MQRFLLLLLLIVSCTPAISTFSQDKMAVLGRWDLEMQVDGKVLPSWLEVQKSGFETLVGKFVYAFGSARPVSEIEYNNGAYHFSIPRQWEPEGQDIELSFKLVGRKLVGSMTYTDGRRYTWEGVRAPKLTYTANPEWGSPINLFNGRNLSGWHHSGDIHQWKVVESVLINPEAGSNLVTDDTFEDFKLHIEFRYPEGSNSGIYLRGRYEVQIEDSKGQEPSSVLFGGIYGFLTPVEMVAKAPGEWQSYDITLVGRRINIVANGKKIICDQEIPGITGGAMDSKEGKPGPIFLQGDHGPVEFRNIILTPLVR